MEQEYEVQSELVKPRRFYFAGLGVFIAASLALGLWAFITLAVTK
jgi:hypothetical protein